MNRLLLIFFLLCATGLSAQKITEIKGYAPNYIGKALEIYQITDYVSQKQEKIASTIVQADSSFSCSFYLDETRKLYVKSNNSSGFLFATPGSTYQVVLPKKDLYGEYRPAGNQVQLIFLDLDSTDINYKILGFDQMVNNFIGRYYTKNNADSVYFVKRLDSFKDQVTKLYAADTADMYFNYHRKFTLARVDDLRFYGNRSKYEKYDFYIRQTPVYYQNEAYMDYVLSYYDGYLKTVNNITNNKFYLGVLKSSPSAIFNGLGTDYAMSHNFKLREMIMIKLIGDCYFDKEYPRSNLVTILDSLKNKSLFPYNATIAAAMKERLTQLVDGGKAPEFNISYNNELYNLKRYEGKHLYVFFVDPTSSKAKAELDLLVPIFQRYSTEVRFLMVLVGDNNQKAKDLIKSYPWEGIVVADNAEIISRYQVVTKPMYFLIDRIGYIVQAPALGPLPNGNYETIDKVFFELKKSAEAEKNGEPK